MTSDIAKVNNASTTHTCQTIDLDVCRSPPDAIILLNSNLLGSFEQTFLRQLPHHQRSAPHRDATSAAVGRKDSRRPLVMAADGAARWALAAGVLQTVNIICGDLDSIQSTSAASGNDLREGADFWRDAKKEMSIAAREYGTANEACLRSGEWWPLEERGSRPSPVGDDDRPPRSPIMTVIKLLDQDSTDFEKCLVLSQHLLLPDARRSSAPRRVAVLGAFGDRWDHWFGSVHSAAKFACPAVQVLLIERRNIMTFCCLPSREQGGHPKDLYSEGLNLPNGKGDSSGRASCTSIFLPPQSHRGFAVMPLGPLPSAVQTEGLRWNVKFDNDDSTLSSGKKPSTVLFGFAKPEQGLGISESPFISTSNEVVDGANCVSVTVTRPPALDVVGVVAVISFAKRRALLSSL
jgi:thiamine pyrophosphokinase